MPDILPPGNMPAPSPGDDPRTFPDFFQSEMWPKLWPGLVHEYSNAAERDADLAALGPLDRAVSWVDDTKTFAVWTGTTWTVLADDTGWMNAGFTPKPGFTIVGQVARRRNGIVAVQINLKATNAVGVGNIANLAVVGIPTTAWRPAQTNGALAGGPSGGAISAHASITGDIVMTWTANGIAAGGSFHIFGTWML